MFYDLPYGLPDLTLSNKDLTTELRNNMELRNNIGIEHVTLDKDVTCQDITHAHNLGQLSFHDTMNYSQTNCCSECFLSEKNQIVRGCRLNLLFSFIFSLKNYLSRLLCVL